MSVATGSVQFTWAENMPRSVYANNELAGHVTPNDGERTSAIYAQLTRLISYTRLARLQSHCIFGYFLLATFQRISQSVSFAGGMRVECLTAKIINYNHLPLSIATD